MKQNTQNRTYITIIIHNLQNQTEANKTYNHTYKDKNGTKSILKNVIYEKAI
jgi:hypothetical protein